MNPKKISALLLGAIMILTLNCKKTGGDEQTAVQQPASKMRAVISMVLGKTVISRGSATQEVKRGTDITEADYIQTFAGSRCVVLFSTGSTLSLQENTKVKISVFLPKGVRSEIANGSILMNVKRLTSDEEFSVGTPTAVAGVRGTKFYVRYDSATRNTRVAVKSGKVQVSPVINVNTNETVKKKLAEQISVNIEANESVNVNQNHVNQINNNLNRNIPGIEQGVSNNNVASVPVVQASGSIIQKSKAAVNNVDTRILDEIQDTADAPQGNHVLVIIANEGAKITVNGKTETGIYNAYHEPGSKIKISVEKAGFKTLNAEYTVPTERHFTPVIQLESTGEQTGQTTTTPPQVVNTQQTTAPAVVMERKELPRVAGKFRVAATAKTPLYTHKGKVFFAGADGKFYIIDMNNEGSVVNTIPINAPIESAPTVFGNIVYFGAMNSRLYAVNLATGALLFTVNLDGPLALKNSVAAHGGFIYAGVNGVVYKINRFTGAVLWKKSTGENMWCGVAVDGNQIYVPEETGTVKALKDTDGTVVWTQKISERISMGKAFVIAGKLVVNTHNGEIKVLNTATGAPMSSNVTIGKLVDAPYQYGNLIYYPTSNGITVVNGAAPAIISAINTAGTPYFGIAGQNVYSSFASVNLKQFNLVGRESWSTTLDGMIVQNPAVDELYVYAMTSSGTLYKLNRRDFEMVRKAVNQ